MEAKKISRGWVGENWNLHVNKKNPVLSKNGEFFHLTVQMPHEWINSSPKLKSLPKSGKTVKSHYGPTKEQEK